MSLLDAPPVIAVPTLTENELAHIHVSPARVLRSEWRKMRTLRSTWLTMALAIASVPGIGVAISWSTVNEWNNIHERHRERFNPLADPLSGFNLAQLAIGVLGVLIIAGEYSGGMIRASLAAVPKRLPVLWSKLTMFTTITLVTMVPVSVATFFISQHILSDIGVQVPWSMPGVPRVVIGVGLYLAVTAALAIGIGAIVRNVAGGIGAFVGVVLVLPVIALALPQTWGDRIDKWLPSNAGQALMSVSSDTATLSPWRGFGVYCLWAAGSLIIAAILLKRRDA